MVSSKILLKDHYSEDYYSKVSLFNFILCISKGHYSEQYFTLTVVIPFLSFRNNDFSK